MDTPSPPLLCSGWVFFFCFQLARFSEAIGAMECVLGRRRGTADDYVLRAKIRWAEGMVRKRERERERERERSGATGVGGDGFGSWAAQAAGTPLHLAQCGRRATYFGDLERRSKQHKVLMTLQFR